MKVTVDGVGDVILSPTGAKALLAILAAERSGQRLMHGHDMHPATRSRLLGQGLIAYDPPNLGHVQLTPAGWHVAYALEAAS